MNSACIDATTYTSRSLSLNCVYPSDICVSNDPIMGNKFIPMQICGVAQIKSLLVSEQSE